VTVDTRRGSSQDADVAVFDPLVRKLVVRIVYDGPGFAGKTTNIERICELVPSERRTELYTPGALKGRTMFFDWVEVDGGKLGGMDLRVQILSVPGQSQRSYRRRPLLFSADTVVFVADSTEEGLPETRRSFKLLVRYMREREEDIPLLMQANKQDMEGARTPEAVLHSLVKNPQISVYGACAHTGEGVRETFQAAMRLAIKDVRERVQRDGLASISGATQTADALFDALLEAEELHDAAEAFAAAANMPAYVPEPYAAPEAYVEPEPAAAQPEARVEPEAETSQPEVEAPSSEETAEGSESVSGEHAAVDQNAPETTDESEETPERAADAD
jgi:signal recognition particle receptor subunit beta